MVVCLRDNTKRHRRQNSSGEIFLMSKCKLNKERLQIEDGSTVRLIRPKPTVTITPDMIHGFGDFRWEEQQSKAGKTGASSQVKHTKTAT